METSQTPASERNEGCGPHTGPGHPADPAEHDLDAPTSLIRGSEPGAGDPTPIVEAGRITAQWRAGRWSRTERLRFARALFGNALREDGDRGLGEQ